MYYFRICIDYFIFFILVVASCYSCHCTTLNQKRASKPKSVLFFTFLGYSLPLFCDTLYLYRPGNVDLFSNGPLYRGLLRGQRATKITWKTLLLLHFSMILVMIISLNNLLKRSPCFAWGVDLYTAPYPPFVAKLVSQTGSIGSFSIFAHRYPALMSKSKNRDDVTCSGGSTSHTTTVENRGTAWSSPGAFLNKGHMNNLCFVCWRCKK